MSVRPAPYRRAHRSTASSARCTDDASSPPPWQVTGQWDGLASKHSFPEVGWRFAWVHPQTSRYSRSRGRSSLGRPASRMQDVRVLPDHVPAEGRLRAPFAVKSKGRAVRHEGAPQPCRPRPWAAMPTVVRRSARSNWAEDWGPVWFGRRGQRRASRCGCGFHTDRLVRTEATGCGPPFPPVAYRRPGLTSNKSLVRVNRRREPRMQRCVKSRPRDDNRPTRGPDAAGAAGTWCSPVSRRVGSSPYGRASPCGGFALGRISKRASLAPSSPRRRSMDTG